MENDHIETVGEMLERDDHEASRRMVQIVAGILIALGLLFTGYLNFQLYSRAFSADSKVFALIPAFLIEGSLATFLLGSFVWFAHGTQGKLSKFFGWAMFAIVALNTVVEFNAQANPNGALSDFLHIYTIWGVPVVVPLTIAFWKATIDADPSISIMRANRKIQQTLQVAKHEATLQALRSEEHRGALRIYGNRRADPINAALRGEIGTADKPPDLTSKLGDYLNAANTGKAETGGTEDLIEVGGKKYEVLPSDNDHRKLRPKNG